MDDPDPREEAIREDVEACRPGRLDAGTLPLSVYRARGDEDECPAAPTAHLVKGPGTFTLDGLQRQFDAAAREYDALSSDADRLAGTIAQAEGRRLDLIAAATDASDDGQVAWIGAIDAWGCSPLPDPPEIFAHLVDALGVVTDVFSGLFLVAGQEQMNTSAHERLKAHAQTARRGTERPTTEGRLRVVADADSEKDTLLLFAGVQNMGQPAETYTARVITPAGAETTAPA